MRALRAALFVVAQAQWANYGPTRPYTFELLNRAPNAFREIATGPVVTVDAGTDCTEAPSTIPVVTLSGGRKGIALDRLEVFRLVGVKRHKTNKGYVNAPEAAALRELPVDGRACLDGDGVEVGCETKPADLVKAGQTVVLLEKGLVHLGTVTRGVRHVHRVGGRPRTPRPAGRVNSAKSSGAADSELL